MKSLRSFCLLLVLLLARLVRAHDGLDLEPPTSAPDAWNFLTLCQANIEKLSAEQRWSEIVIQSSLSIQAARYLRERVVTEPADEALRLKLSTAEAAALGLATACLNKAYDGIPAQVATYRAALDAAKTGFDPQIVNAPVYACPMCRGIRELDPKIPCFKCGMALVPRIIPASSLYNTPGQPSVALTAEIQPPLTVGQPSTVTVRLARKKDRAPLSADDLLVVHTQRIHLLIIDQSLTDYHHEHPRPTATPGEYVFTFTPREPGAYRVFADIVPALSNVQEYAVCDLPAALPGRPLTARAEVSSAVVEGRRYELNWETQGQAIHAKVPVRGTIAVASADGQPFTQLEPIMGTYAHLVCFHEDRSTVLHIHPTGTEPKTADDRGGPSFRFQFYAPKPGFYRIYSQVQIGGQSVFAPFGLTVEP